jgi:hypothetical protein
MRISISGWNTRDEDVDQSAGAIIRAVAAEREEIWRFGD